MLLEKTVLNVDVLTVDVRVGRQVHRRLVDVIGTNQRYSEQLGERLASVVLDADDALIEVGYLRDISCKQPMEGVIENLDHAEAAKFITREIRQRAQERVPTALIAFLRSLYLMHGLDHLPCSTNCAKVGLERVA
jgi:hypothetical protein